jgi:hypothetical protein
MPTWTNCLCCKYHSSCFTNAENALAFLVGIYFGKLSQQSERISSDRAYPHSPQYSGTSVGTKPMSCCAECRHNGDNNTITIWEQLAPPGEEASNICTWQWGRLPVGFDIPTESTCTSLAYGKDCGKIIGSVYIMFSVIESWSTRTANSRMEEFLQRLGVGNVTVLDGRLFVLNQGVDINANLSLSFFTKLQRVDVLNIVGSSFPSYVSRTNPQAIVGFPGFKSIEQTKFLAIQGTALSVLDDFAGIQCAGSVYITGNNYLTSIEGIANMRVGIDGLWLTESGLRWLPISHGYQSPQGYIPNYFYLEWYDSYYPKNNPALLQPLSRMAGCEGGRAPNCSAYFSAGCSSSGFISFEGWPALCRVIKTLDCSS